MTTKSKHRPYYLDNRPTTDETIYKAQKVSYDFLLELQRKSKRNYYGNMDDKQARILMRNAASILRTRISLTPVETTIDEIDGNPYIRGLWPYTITEVIGKPDIAKSELCYDIAARLLCKTRDMHVIFITPTNSFSRDAISPWIKMYGKIPDPMLKRVHVYDICSLSMLVAAYNMIKFRHMDYHKIGLVVIDGILTYFKDTVDEIPDCLNIPIMTKFFQSIKVLSIISKFPVLVTNELRDEVDTSGGIGTAGPKSPKTFLDERYREYVDLRIWLHKTDEKVPNWTATMFAPSKDPKLSPIYSF